MKRTTFDHTPDGLRDRLRKLERQVADLQRVRDAPQPYNEVQAGGGGYAATVTVAASDAAASSRAAADFVCDGTADQDEINAATQICFELAMARGYYATDNTVPGGRVLLSEGTFYTSAAIDDRYPEVEFDGPPNMTLQGQGMTATVIKQVGFDFAIESYGQGYRLCDFTLDASGVTGVNLAGGLGVYLEGQHASVERVRFREVGYQNFGNLHIQEDYGRVRDCEFLFPQRDGGGIRLGNSANHCVITGCYFAHIPNQAVWAPFTSYVSITGNTIEYANKGGSGTDAFAVGDYSVVVGNICRDWLGSPATITAGTGSQVANNVLL